MPGQDQLQEGPPEVPQAIRESGPATIDPVAALDARIRNDFHYHAPDGGRRELHEVVREALRGVAQQFNAELPHGRELSLALTKLE